MRITALLENTTAREDMQVEHGLSLYIETAHKTILFDMGQTALFAENARTLGLSLERVDLAVLSHGHYDHGGGLQHFLRSNAHAPVYIHRDAFLPHYNGTEKYIGLDTSLMHDPRIVYTDDAYRIDGALSLLSCNQMPRLHTPPASGLNERVGDDLVPDDFRHEQYLLIEEAGRRVLISGCSHKGILNIAAWLAPDVLIGGFHFSKLPTDAWLTDAARTLAAYPTEYYTCHCTGRPQFLWMQQYMPRLHGLSCGQTIEI